MFGLPQRRNKDLKERTMDRVQAVGALLVAAAVVSAPLSARQASGPQRFSSASIRAIGNPGGKPAAGVAVFNAPRVSLRQLIERAYGVTRARTAGGVDWMDDLAWQVVGMSDRRAPRDADVKEMARSLLADRFKLRAEFQTRPMSALVVTLGGLGAHPSIRRTTSRVNCQPFLNGDKGLIEAPKDEEGNPLCGPARGEHAFERPIYHFRSAPLSSVARYLEIMLQRVVIWEPQTEGLFDVDFATPDGYAGEPSVGDVDAFMDAIEAQFGATVAVRTIPVKVLVVKSAVRPVLDQQ
jgi:uncharacterized protein (TIGR03435 family)